MSQAHVSFNLFGITFILVLGLLVIIVSFVLEPLASCIQRRFKLSAYRRLEWHSTSAFQLQRLAHEELGIGFWEQCDQAIPTTAAGTVLASLDISDERHPVLRMPASADEKRMAKERTRPMQMSEKAPRPILRIDSGMCVGSDATAVDLYAATTISDKGPSQMSSSVEQGSQTPATAPPGSHGGSTAPKGGRPFMATPATATNETTLPHGHSVRTTASGAPVPRGNST
jgi:hypothetical protein